MRRLRLTGIQQMDNLSNDELLDFMMMPNFRILGSMSHQRLISFINDLRVKNFLFENITYYSSTSALSKLLRRLSNEEFNHFIDSESLNIINNSPRKFVLIQTIFLNDNPAIAESLKDSALASYILDNFHIYSSFIEQMNEEKAISLFQNIMQKHPEKVGYIVHLNTRNQLAVIKYMGIYNFYHICENENIFLYLANEVISTLICKEPFYQYFADLPTNKIIELINRGLILPAVFSSNKEFIKKVATLKDPNEYRLLDCSIMNYAYNNFRRSRLLHLEQCITYLEENGRTYNESDILPYYLIEPTLSAEIYDHLFYDDYLEAAREKYYDEQVSLISNCFGLLKEYYDYYMNPNSDVQAIDSNVNFQSSMHMWQTSGGSKEELYQILLKASTKRFEEILIDRYYKDVAYNFLANLSNALAFLKKASQSDLKLNDVEYASLKERLQRYETILNFPNLSLEEQLAFYYSFDPSINYAYLFYEDYRVAKDTSYEDMNREVFKPSHTSNLYNEELSQKLGIDVYELKGEPFYAFIHLTSIKRSEASRDSGLWQDRISIFLEDPLSDIEFPIGSSISLASDRKLEALRSVNEYVTFGYNHLEPSRIAHVYHADSYSSFRRSGVGMCKICDIETAEDLTSKTRRYSEILYQEVSNIVLDPDVLARYSKFKPNYLYCYDEITIWDMSVAQRLGIPILLVHTNCYYQEIDDYIDYNRDNEYITSLDQAMKIKSYQRK